MTRSPDDLSPLLASSVFVLTDEQGFRMTRALTDIPQTALVRSGERRCLLRVAGTKRVSGVDWKVKVAGALY